MSFNYRPGGGYYRGRGGYDRGGYDRGGYDRGYGNFRGGRGGYKPRRYWDRDDDDYRRRSGDRDRGRDRGRSRSRSRSDSRSRSRSDSRSRSRSRGRDRSRSRDRDLSRDRERAVSPRRTVEEYQPKPVPVDAFPNATGEMNQQFEATYVPAQVPHKDSWTPGDGPPAFAKQQQLAHSQNGQVGGVPAPISAQYAVDQYQIQYQMANYQKQQQAQADAYKIVAGNVPAANRSSLSGSGTAYDGYGGREVGYQSQKQHQLPDMLYPPSETQTQLTYPTSTSFSLPKGNEEATNVGPKKKKDLKKKKRRRKSSSSSSSSSSSESSDSRSKAKHKSKSKRNSDDSSDSSSEDDKRDKDKSGGSGLTAQQKDVLLQQWEGYKKKLDILEREIKRLRTKEDELAIAKADIKLIEENLKLQGELKGRCKAVNIVLEKINTVLRGGNSLDQKPKLVPPPPPKISQAVSPHPTQQVTLVSSPPLGRKEEKQSGFDFFDNGLHWCRLCNVFPETLRAMLDHFHSPDHHAQVEQLGIDEKPWHKRNSLREAKPEPGAKKVPYRGIQFFTPVQGWYCRICSAWLGDHHCAIEHLKSEEHCNNFTNFLEEHPDWETKFLSDRDKARARSGLDPGVGGDRQPQLKGGKYSFETNEVKGVGVRYQPGVQDFEEDENAKSIRVQMRNISKENESRSLAYSSALPAANVSKDSSVDEWMGKTQSQNVALDIDTQKFAAIVRQKHGAAKEKEKEKELAPKKQTTVVQPPPNYPPNYPRGRELGRDRDYESFRRFSDNNKRYQTRVELSFSDRDRERDRERDRGGRGVRRRSRSKSRDRSRERESDRDRRRRDRSRSKSRERDREREKDRPDPKEKDQIRRLPIIGKMPLYKKPTAAGKEVESSGTDKSQAPVPVGEYGPTPVPRSGRAGEEASTNLASFTHAEESNMSGRSENSMTGYGYSMSFDDNRGAATGYENSGSTDEHSSYYQQKSVAPAKRVSEDTKPPGETGTGVAGASGGALPDDLQHALDIIYSGAGGKPSTIPFPPPGIGKTADMGMPPPAQNFGEFSSSGYNYMGYEPYQHSFEGYGPVAQYGEMSDMPPGTTDEPPQPIGQSGPSVATESKVHMYTAANDSNSASCEPEPAAPGDDDFDDLRMLGIDVDDTAVVHLK